MKVTSTTGPDRPGRDQLTDPAEVAEARRILMQGRANAKPEFVQYPIAPGADADWLSEAETFDSAAEAGAARDRELWGDDPWTV